MTTKQRSLLDFLEQAAAGFDLHGYKELARTSANVVEHLHRGDTVCAVLVAATGGLGPGFVEKLRLEFGVKKLE